MENSLNWENVPVEETKTSGKESKLSLEKVKDYGKKSLSPFVEIFHRYQDEITPYFDSISKGLRGGALTLQGEGHEKVVAGRFNEAADLLDEARSRLSGSTPQEIMDYIESKASIHPGLMFSASYLTGMFFGRLGRHVGRHGLQVNKASEQGEGGSYGTRH